MDPYLVAGLALCAVLTGCLAVMFAMRDRVSAPAHPVSRTMWCDRHRGLATVEFVERVSTGLTIRAVRRCTLRALGEHCGESCRYWSTASLDSGAGSRTSLPPSS